MAFCSKQAMFVTLSMFLLLHLVHMVHGNCTRKTIDTFTEKVKTDNDHVFAHAETIVEDFPKCFFGKTKYSKDKKKCRKSCQSYYNKCTNTVPKKMAVLYFPCKLGLAQCMYDCDPIVRPVSKSCIQQCRTDFRLCFFDNGKSFETSMICVEARKICDTQPNCYRLSTVEPYNIAKQFRL